MFDSQYRREFIKTTGAAAIPSIMKASSFKYNSDTLKVGLIGCGGRGSGAAVQALTADKNVVLSAMADAFEDRLNESLKAISDEHPERVEVEHKFVGFDAYKQLLATDVDVVILTTPPCFRPAHLEAAIAAGKHVFCEKPVAVDAPGIRRVIAVAQEAKKKNLSLMSGFCWRFDFPKRATFQRILDGSIGDVMTIYNTYNTGELWSKPYKPGWTGMEKKLRNWLYYNWMSGDHIAEQAVHSLDLMSWAFGDVLPLSATGTGGRQVRTAPEFGNVYDHFAIEFEYPNGAKGFHFSRQQKGASRSYGMYANGTQGMCNIDVFTKHEITGKVNWKYEGEKNNMYQTEHDELFAAIRKGTAFNDGERMANSTMLAIMGRMVAYTGQTLTWDEAINSQEILGPTIDQYNWELDWPDAPVAMPGITKFI